MRNKPIITTTTLLCLLLSGRGFGQDAPPDMGERLDTVKSGSIYFPVGQSSLDSEYMNNAATLRGIDAILSNKTIRAGIDSVRVWGISSPEGNAKLNQRLALQRTLVLTDYITATYPSLDRSRIGATWGVAPWESLRQNFMTDKALPARVEVLAALDSGSTSEVIEAQLRRNNKAWSYIVDNYLDRMRYDQLEVVYRRPVPRVVEPESPFVSRPAPVRDTVTVLREVVTYIMTPVEPCRKPLFALKTNLLFDLASALNIEIEVPIGRRWSIAGEYVFPWWLWENSQICLQTLSGSIEGRYWFGDRMKRPQLTGWFAGVYLGGGYYDLEWKRRGYQGEYIVPGISGGFAHKIGRNLSLEYALSLGVVRTRYREYEAFEKECGWCLQRTKSDVATWIGPTKLKVSLVWMINSNKKCDLR